MKGIFSKLMQGILILGLCLGLAGVLSKPVHAVNTCTWTGATNRVWTTAGNWSCGHVPASQINDDIVIADVVNDPLITSSIEAQAHDVTINAGGILEVNSCGSINLVTGGTSIINNGTIKTTDTADCNSITFSTAGQFVNNGTIDILAGTMNIWSSQGGTQTGTLAGQYGQINLHGYSSGVFTFNSSSSITVKGIYLDYIPTVNIYGTLYQNYSGSTFSIYGSNVKVYITTHPLKVGTVSLHEGDTFGYVMGGSLSGSLSIPLSARLTGAGSISEDLTNAGTVSPGASPDIITVGGNYIQESTGILEIELGGTVAGTDYDQLAVTGAVTLNGTLDISLIDAFNPALGQSFTIMTYGSHSGEFDTVSLPDLDAGLDWGIAYNATSIQLSVIASTDSISGIVTCVGSYSGSTHTVFVDLWTNTNISPPDDSVQISCGDGYFFDDLVDGTYYIDAWLDLNDSGGGPPDTGEPIAWYGAPDPIVILSGNGSTGINIILGEQYFYMPLILR